MDTLKEISFRKYRSETFTQNIILGIVKGGKIYACYTSYDNINYLKSLKCDRDSDKKGGRVKWRFRPNNKQRDLILESSLKVKKIGTLDDLLRKKGNKGEAFESIIRGYEMKDNICHTEAGDYIDPEGQSWQIKFENATAFYTV